MENKAQSQLGVGGVALMEEERKYIQKIFDSDRVSYGPLTSEFEQRFAKEHEVNYAMFCNSGTSALQAGLHALKIKYGYQNGDGVIVPALTFVASVNVILQNNLTPVFVDVDRDYFEINSDLIENAITSSAVKVRAIMPVHIGGLPCDMTSIMEIAKKYDLQVIEDSCETMFASHNGKRVGSFGDVSCFSTYVAHILSTGVGGFACTNDHELAVIIKSLFNHGRDSIYLSIDDDKGKQGSELFNVVSKRFMFDHVGYSYRATEFEAAIGLAQMDRWKQNIARRKEIAAMYTQGLSDLRNYLVLPKERPETDHAYMFYPIVVTDNYDGMPDDHYRSGLVSYLENHAIETRYLLPLTNQPVYKKLFGDDLEDRYPVAKFLNNHGFYIGCHPGLSNEDVAYIIKTFHTFYE